MVEASSTVIAIIDDDSDSRLLAAAILANQGYKTVEDDGSDGVAARIVAAQPELILLDLHLEGRTGIDALREIRALPALARIPVIALTAALDTDPLLRDSTDFDGIIPKPLDSESLSTTLARVRHAQTAAIGDSSDPFAALHDRFRAGLADRLARIESAHHQKDERALFFEVHRLRGAAAAYGLPDIADLSAHLENALRQNDPTDSALSDLTSALRSLI
jgi:CheY-like chemotaxis protein